jgi:type VI secretion system protein ImpA
MGILDTNKLLTPISDQSRCGGAKETDDKVMYEFAELNDLFASARQIQKAKGELELTPPGDLRKSFLDSKKGSPNDPYGDPKWPVIERMCVDLLTSSTKDTRILAWLFEAMVRNHGFRGLTESTGIAISLFETFGSDLFPQDSGDPMLALRSISNVNRSQTMLDGLWRVEVGSSCPISYSMNTTSQFFEKQSTDDRVKLQELGVRSRADIEKAVRDCPSAEISAFLNDLKDAIQATTRLDGYLQDKSGKEALRFSTVRDHLQTIEKWFKEMLPEVPKVDPSATTPEAGGVVSSTAASSSASGGVSGVIQTREDALRNLQRVADFFRKAEPHSPVSYAVEQAVKWGKMPLPELLKALIPDSNALGQLCRLTGIPNAMDSDGEKNSE